MILLYFERRGKKVFISCKRINVTLSSSVFLLDFPRNSSLQLLLIHTKANTNPAKYNKMGDTGKLKNPLGNINSLGGYGYIFLQETTLFVTTSLWDICLRNNRPHPVFHIKPFLFCGSLMYA